ncbi:MAG: sulfatase-like hydrolase/transferase [Gemmatimonadales bacterium]
MSSPGSPAVAEAARSGPRLLPLAAWCGLVAGFGDLLVAGGRHLFLGNWLRLGPHALWLTPLSDTAVILTIGLAAAAVVGLLKWRPLRIAAVFALFTAGALAVFLAQHWTSGKAAFLLAAGIGARLTQLAVRNPERVDRMVRRSLPGLVVALIVFAVGVPLTLAIRERVRIARLPDAPPGAPSVLLLFLDTVRAHNLSVYGYGRPTSPALEAFGRDAVRFDQAIAPSSWTLPSHAAVFTGRQVPELGVGWFVGLDERYPLLAEMFAAKGYVPAAFVANQYYAAPNTGLSRGFFRYDVYPLSWQEALVHGALVRRALDRRRVRELLGNFDQIPRVRAATVRRRFLDWLPRAGERPVFAFLNFNDAHEPYLPPPPFDRRFGRGHPVPHPRTDYSHRDVSLPDRFRKAMTPTQRQAQLNAYDGALAYLDAELGRLFEALRASGRLDRTIVVVVGDHGEALGEGDRFRHGTDLYPAVTRVPLLIRAPGRLPAGGVVGATVSLRDLGATIFDLAGVRAPETLPGTSLVPTVLRGDSAARSPAFAAVQPGRETRWTLSVQDGGLQFVRLWNGNEELYSVERDSFALRNLLADSTAQPPDTRRLRILMDSLVRLARPAADTGR